MNPSSVSPSPLSPTPAPRRRISPWVLGLGLAPFGLLALAVASYLPLDRDAATLRRQVMQASGSSWQTQVQFSVGSVTLGGLRTGLAFISHPNIAPVRLGLRAVSRASVGVYRRESGEGPVAFTSLLREADRGMRQRGWTRLVAVNRRGECVVAYGPANAGTGRETECCVAVLKPRELVVVAVTLDAEALADFLHEVLPEELSSKFHRRRQSASR